MLHARSWFCHACRPEIRNHRPSYDSVGFHVSQVSKRCSSCIGLFLLKYEILIVDGNLWSDRSEQILRLPWEGYRRDSDALVTFLLGPSIHTQATLQNKRLYPLVLPYLIPASCLFCRTYLGSAPRPQGIRNGTCYSTRGLKSYIISLCNTQVLQRQSTTKVGD